MTALVMDGVVLRREIMAAVRAELVEAGSDGPVPCLATVVVGDNPRCHIFARGKRSAAAEAGMRTVRVDLTASASQDEVEEAVARLGRDPAVHGTFVQLPLPAHLDLDRVLGLVPPAKDVDGMRAAHSSLDSLHAPTTPLAVVRLLERYDVRIKGRRTVVVGRSAGMARLLTDRGADVYLADDASPDVCRDAEVLVSAAGRPGTIGVEHVRPGAAVVDVTGDVDLMPVEAVAGAIARYPTAVGPVAIACLLRNTVDASRIALP